MPYFSEAAGAVVAADTNSTFAALDGALLNTARLTVSILEANTGSGLTHAHSQKVLESVASSFESVIVGRKRMVAAHRLLVAAKGESNLAVVDYGCGTGPITGALIDEPRLAAIDA